MRSKTVALARLVQCLNKPWRSSSEPGADRGPQRGSPAGVVDATGSLLIRNYQAKPVISRASWGRLTRSLPLPVLILLLLSALGTAQENTRPRSPGAQPASGSSSHQVVSLAEGGFVAFKSETAWTNKPKSGASVKALHGEFRSQAFVDEDHIIHRVLLDTAGRYVFGYDLIIQAVPASKTFTIG